MTRRFYTSDTHFWHTRIIDLCNRPFSSVEQMNATMVENWNAVVGDDGQVTHEGDLALGPWVEWKSTFAQLKGDKYLITGNHDRHFEFGSPKHQRQREKMVERFVPVYREFFTLLGGHGSTTIGGHPVMLSHFPYDGDSHGPDRHQDARLPDEGVILVHGHTHGKEKVSRSRKGTLQVHVGVDAWDYAPVPEEEIAALIEAHL